MQTGHSVVNPSTNVAILNWSTAHRPTTKRQYTTRFCTAPAQAKCLPNGSAGLNSSFTSGHKFYALTIKELGNSIFNQEGCCKKHIQYHRRSKNGQGVAASSGEAATSSLNAKSLKLPGYIVLWYGFNVIFNILNKQVLNAFPCPWLVSLLQLVASGAFMCILWATKLQPVPKITVPVLKGLSLVSFFHTIGHVAACISFSKVAVSFGHIVKSTEPVFSLIFSGPLLGETNPLYVWMSVLPIVFGCSLSALKEVSFSWSGFNNAMISNLGMVLRGIYSKKMMVDFKAIDGINLFGLMSIFSILYCAPLALVLESHTWGAASSTAIEILGQTKFFYLLVTGGIFFHLYNQAAYMVFAQGIAPVTFSVANTMKRVSVVIGTVAFFRNPVSPLNWLGSAMAILGTYLYSLARAKATEAKALKSA